MQRVGKDRKRESGCKFSDLVWFGLQREMEVGGPVEISAGGFDPLQVQLVKSLTCTLKRIRNIYSQNHNSATSLPSTKFIFPKQIFIIIPCGPSLPMSPKARVLALISIMPPNSEVPYTSSWNSQMLSAKQLLPGQAVWVALPSAHYGENLTYWAIILQLNW